MWSLAHKTYTKSYNAEWFGASNIFCFIVYLIVFALPFVLGSFQKCECKNMKIIRRFLDS